MKASWWRLKRLSPLMDELELQRLLLLNAGQQLPQELTLLRHMGVLHFLFLCAVAVDHLWPLFSVLRHYVLHLRTHQHVCQSFLNSIMNKNHLIEISALVLFVMHVMNNLQWNRLWANQIRACDFVIIVSKMFHGSVKNLYDSKAWWDFLQYLFFMVCRERLDLYRRLLLQLGAVVLSEMEKNKHHKDIRTERWRALHVFLTLSSWWPSPAASPAWTCPCHAEPPVCPPACSEISAWRCAPAGRDTQLSLHHAGKRFYQSYFRRKWRSEINTDLGVSFL